MSRDEDRATLCQTCHEVFTDDYRDHVLDQHCEQVIKGDVLWFKDVEGTAALLLAECANPLQGDQQAKP